MADDALLLILVLMTLLLLVFAWQILTTDSADSTATQAPTPAPLPELLVSMDDATQILWVNEIQRPEVSGDPPWDLPPEQQLIGRPGVSGGPPWGPTPKPRAYRFWPRRYLHQYQ